MTENNSSRQIADIVARAESFLKSDLISAKKYGPQPKCEGKNQNRGKGRAFQWLCQHASYTEKKCLFWPFSKCDGRAGAVGYCGVAFKPTRLMCLLAHGAPPSGQLRAANTCGRGNKGCINPNHLVWRTQSECRLDEFKDGRRKSYGRGGKITPSEAAEIRTLGGVKTTSEIGQIYGLSSQRISEILRGVAHVTPRLFNPRDGRFYPRVKVDGRDVSLGGFASAKQAAVAYEAARLRMRRHEPVLMPSEEKPSVADIKRWYQPPRQQAHFGDREGELVVSVEADQEKSTYLLHNALNDLHPKVKTFVIAASTTGDLTEAAKAAGLSQEQVAAVLPRLKVYLQRHLQ